MTFSLVGVTFSDPYESTDYLENKLGVYIVWKRVGTTTDYNFVDVGQSGEVKDRVENHDRKDCWKNETNKPYYSAFYSNNSNEINRVEKDLRDAKNIPCGER